MEIGTEQSKVSRVSKSKVNLGSLHRGLSLSLRVRQFRKRDSHVLAGVEGISLDNSMRRYTSLLNPDVSGSISFVFVC